MTVRKKLKFRPRIFMINYAPIEFSIEKWIEICHQTGIMIVDNSPRPTVKPFKPNRELIIKYKKQRKNLI